MRAPRQSLVVKIIFFLAHRFFIVYVCRPVRLEDFTGLQLAWWGVGTLDLFHDEDITYVERLRAADVPCEVEMVKGAFYGFDGIVPKAEVSQLFFNSRSAMLRRGAVTGGGLANFGR